MGTEYTTNSYLGTYRTLNRIPSCISSHLHIVKAAMVFIAILAGFGSTAKAQTVTIQIGTETNQNTSTTWPAPYGNWFWGARNQYLVLASELLSAGAAPGFISSVAFDVVQQNGVPLSDFAIKIGATSATSLATWQTGLATVFGPTTYTEANGWNTHTFSNMFHWDGTSNIVIETCFNNGSYTNNAVVRQSNTPQFTSARVFWQDAAGVCQNTSAGSAYSQRPNMQLGVTPAHQVDMVLKELLSPETKCGLTNIEPIEVVLQYFGSLTLPLGTPIQMRATLDNQNPIVEVFHLYKDMSLTDTISYTFNTALDLSLEKPYNLVVEAITPGDGNPANNIIQADIRNNFTNEFPIITDFENWGPKSTMPSCQVSNGEMRGGWMQPKTDDGSWLIGQGSTSTIGTGPTYDYSEQSLNGKYLYVNTSAPCNVSGNTYLLRSACIDLAMMNKPGLNFAYHMYGSSMGTLRIDLVRFHDGFVIQNLFTASSNHGNKWNPVVLPLSNYKPDGIVQVQFRYISGGGSQGDIGLDDIRIGELPDVNLPANIQDCGFVEINPGLAGATYEWSTGETTPSITLTNPGPGPITKTIGVKIEQGGLYRIDSITVTLNPGPVIDLGPDPLVLCGANNVVLDAKNGGMSHLWDNGSTAQTRTVTESGIYWVQADDGLGCVKRDTIDVVLEHPPVAAFTFNNVSYYSFIQFNSTGSSSSSYEWDFGDGNFSDLKDPQHYYATGGQYTVTLTVTNECGTSTISQLITVWPTGIDDIANLWDISLFPNPTPGAVTLTWGNPGVDKATLQLVDAVGRMVWQQMVNPIRASNWQYTFEVNQPAGIYQLIIKTENGAVTKSLVFSR